MTSLRILIADDCELALLTLRGALMQLGHTVAGEAADGEHIVRLAWLMKADLVILDIEMPRMDGIEAARQISSQCRMPILISSCHTEAGMGAKAGAAGAHAYLVKPFTADQLKVAIELTLGTYQRSTRLEQKLQLMNEALAARKVMERAKGILMRQAGVDARLANRNIRNIASSVNLRPVDVARSIIHGTQTGRQISLGFPNAVTTHFPVSTNPHPAC